MELNISGNSVIEQVIIDQMLTNLAVIVTLSGVLLSGIAFWKTFSKIKKSEQYKLVNDILVLYSNAQINYTKTLESTLKQQELQEEEKKSGYYTKQLQTLREVAFMEILNVLEWSSFLILRSSIDKELSEFLESPITTNYEMCVELYPSVLHDENKFKDQDIVWEMDERST